MHSAKQLEICTIKVGNSLRDPNQYKALLLDLSLGLYFLYILGSVIQSDHPYQSRVLIYCMLAIILDRLQILYQYTQLQDPLLLSSGRKCLRLATFIVSGNMLYLVMRIIMQNRNFHSLIIFIHLITSAVLTFNNIDKKINKLQPLPNNFVYTRILNPLLLFLFNSTSQTSLSHFSYLQFIIFIGNLFLGVQLQRIILLKQCYWLGWKKQNEGNRQKKIWIHQQALRANTFICSGLLPIRYQISVTLIHTILIGFASYYLRLSND